MMTPTNSGNDSLLPDLSWKAHIELFTPQGLLLGSLGCIEQAEGDPSPPTSLVLDPIFTPFANRAYRQGTPITIRGGSAPNMVIIEDRFTSTKHGDAIQLHFINPSGDGEQTIMLRISKGVLMDQSDRPAMWHPRTNRLYLAGAPEGSMAICAGLRIIALTGLPDIIGTPVIKPQASGSTNYIAKGSNGDLVLGVPSLSFTTDDYDDYNVWKVIDANGTQYLEYDTTNDHLHLATSSNTTLWKYQRIDANTAHIMGKVGQSGAAKSICQNSSSILCWGDTAGVTFDYPPELPTT